MKRGKILGRPRLKFTKDELAELRELRTEGKTWAEIEASNFRVFNAQDRADPLPVPVLSISGGLRFLELGKGIGRLRNRALQRLAYGLDFPVGSHVEGHRCAGGSKTP